MTNINLYQWYTEIIPPSPAFTEKDLPDLSSRVYLVTGGASGIGFELCKVSTSPSSNSPPLSNQPQTEPLLKIRDRIHRWPIPTQRRQSHCLDPLRLPRLKRHTEIHIHRSIRPIHREARRTAIPAARAATRRSLAQCRCDGPTHREQR